MDLLFPDTEREETKRERKRKNEIWLEPKMAVTPGEILPSIESTWLPQNPANVSFLKLNRGFIKGQPPRELNICERDFAQLLLTTCLTFSIKDHIQVNYPLQVH